MDVPGNHIQICIAGAMKPNNAHFDGKMDGLRPENRLLWSIFNAIEGSYGGSTPSPSFT